MLNGTVYDKLCQRLRPEDYANGRNFNDIDIPPERLPEEDDSWGFLTPEALAQDEVEWNNIKLKETADEREGLRQDYLYTEGTEWEPPV